MAYKILIIIALLAIYAGHFADAEDKCDSELKKEYLKDCEASGDHPPEECKRSGAADGGNTGSDGPCLAKACAKECKDAGGDEVFAYAKYKWWGYFDYYNYICCKSTNEGQAKETEPKKYSVKTLLDPQNA